MGSAAKKLRTMRSAFTREALRSALKEGRVRELESKHREGYSASRLNAASSATGSRNRSGVIDERENRFAHRTEILEAKGTVDRVM